MMHVPKSSVMAIKSYSYQAEMLVKDYLLADSLLPYTSIIAGIFMCKMVYDLIQLFSSYYFKGYAALTKIQRIEWNNRGMSSTHALYITVMALYIVFISDLFSDNHLGSLITYRASPLSNFTLGVSLGYFISDLGMIFWLFPSLGGMEYVIHHTLSVIGIAYTMFTGEGQLYTYMLLISEVTTPGINLRWFLDTAGMKRSPAYLINGVVMFFAWLIARILLFFYIFYHEYLHYDQVKQMHLFGYLLVLIVPVVLAVMNMMWFSKILRGLRKQLAKRQ